MSRPRRTLTRTVPLFRKKRSGLPHWDGAREQDREIVEQLVRAGADLAQLRMVDFYCYAPSSEVAQLMQDEARANGFTLAAEEPVPDFPDHWPMTCTVPAAITPAFIRESTSYFETLARTHGAEYDGWGTSVQTSEPEPGQTSSQLLKGPASSSGMSSGIYGIAERDGEAMKIRFIGRSQQLERRMVMVRHPPWVYCDARYAAVPLMVEPFPEPIARRLVELAAFKRYSKDNSW